jgi:hypothetical protein
MFDLLITITTALHRLVNGRVQRFSAFALD